MRGNIAAARLWATDRQPYLATALLASPVVVAPGIGTVAVDDRWRLHLDPEVVERWAPQELGRVLLHHVGHLLREHADRARAAGVGAGAGAAERWVRAADAEINDDLAAAGLLPPDAPVLPSSFGGVDGRLAEEYFELLGRREEEHAGAPASPDGGDAAAGAGGACHECGSGAHGQRRPWEAVDGDGPGVPPEDGALLRRAVASDVAASAATAPGTVPGGWLRWAQDLLEPKLDWRRLLAAEVRRGLRWGQGRVDYSYRRPGRRQASLPDVVLPSLHRPVPEVAVVVDTSGSMGTAALTAAVAEVEGVLRATAGRGRVRVLSVDAEVHAVTAVRRAADIRLAGGGGTDLGVGLAAAAQLRPRPSLVVVVTDGHTPWPVAAPAGAHVVVALLHGGVGAPPPPAWARAVVVPA